MADRSRRPRRQISDATDESSGDSLPESEEDFDPRKADSMRRAGKVDNSASASASAISRSKRVSAGPAAASRSTTSIQRSVTSPSDDKRQSLKLTVKAPPSKLREVVRVNELEALQDTLGGGQVLDGPRNRRRAAAPPRTSVRAAERPRYAEYAESDLDEDDDEGVDEDDEEEEEEGDEDGEEDEDTAAIEDEEMNDFERVGAEAEGGTDEEDDDVEMEDAPIPPKPPRITLKPPAKTADPKHSENPKVLVSPPKVGPLKSVEQQEIDDNPGDDEVDDSSDDDSDGDEDNTNLNDDDAEGDEEELENEDAEAEDEELEEEEGLEDDEEDDEDDEDSDATPASGSATPDLTKLTKRQRGRPEDSTHLLALDMAPQQRKFFTDAEKAMKKDEHARKRKELTKRKVQEEKTAALNRLLKPQANKARGAAPKPETLAAAAAAAAATGSAVDEEEYFERAHPLYTRWISTKDGVRLGVPEEWLGKRVGAVFGPVPMRNGSLVQEVE